MPFEPEMLEIRSKVQKTQILA